MSFFDNFKIGENFSVLSDFAQSEFLKLVENLGLQETPKSFIKFTERKIKKLLKLYVKPIFKEEKRRIKVQIVLNTMPHSKAWKFFHSSLWAQAKYILDKEKSSFEDQEKKPDFVSTAVVVSQNNSPPVDLTKGREDGDYEF